MLLETRRGDNSAHPLGIAEPNGAVQERLLQLTGLRRVLPAPTHHRRMMNRHGRSMSRRVS